MIANRIHENEKNAHQCIQHYYHDRSQDTPREHSLIALNICRKRRQNSNGAVSSTEMPLKKNGLEEAFPMKLHKILEHSEKVGLSDVISWKIHGRAFAINNSKVFFERIISKFFRQTRPRSFYRQLNLYGFHRITQGLDKGAYYHELFLRGKPYLASKILRQKVKGTKVRGPSKADTEPDFYSMPYVFRSKSLPQGDSELISCAFKLLSPQDSEKATLAGFDEETSYQRQTQQDNFFFEVGDLDPYCFGTSLEEESLSDFSYFDDFFSPLPEPEAL